ncbi:hypothetical protein DEA8626_00052 [Defluviimonas aquaemixtae]|uniref:Sulfotransferase domain-containing protein n=1 Tax=Albidovulum aquaemixtae TaxID=1542388 RepID=A0A2R8B1U1_9RHOB|nr:hypothetical protein [Defluviimonas aquaemixtae]SPH16543.1 hypothetical protein DEA8626_00052 [Defluviimonas aquaemixtae]
MKKTLIVHAGLHKTGSTAAQIALMGLRDVIEARGVLLHSPDGRRIAHHQHASAIAHEKRFARKAAMFERLAEAARTFKGHSIFISSEDFESALGDPDALRRLSAFCERADLRPLFLIYLRSPIDYFESLYLEMLRHGQPLAADELAEDVLQEGQYSWRKWTFHFDASAVAHAIDGVGLSAKFRDYHALASGSTVSDLLETLGFAELAAKAPAEARANVRRANKNLLRFLHNRHGEAAPSKQWLRPVEGILRATPPRLSRAMRGRFQSRFRAATEGIDAAYGLGLTEALLAPPPRGPSTRLESVFSVAAADRLMRLWKDCPGAPPESEVARLAEEWGEGPGAGCAKG